MGQQADGVVTADGAEDGLDGLVPEGLHQVAGPGLRVVVEVFGALQRVGHDHDLQAVLPLQTLLGHVVFVEELRFAQDAAGEGDDGDLVAGTEPFGFSHGVLLIC